MTTTNLRRVALITPNKNQKFSTGPNLTKRARPGIFCVALTAVGVQTCLFTKDFPAVQTVQALPSHSDSFGQSGVSSRFHGMSSQACTHRAKSFLARAVGERDSDSLPANPGPAMATVEVFFDNEILFNEYTQLKVTDLYEEYLKFVFKNFPEAVQIEQNKLIEEKSLEQKFNLDSFIAKYADPTMRTSDYPNFILAKRRFGKLLVHLAQKRAENEAPALLEKNRIKLVRGRAIYLRGISVQPSFLKISLEKLVELKKEEKLETL